MNDLSLYRCLASPTRLAALKRLRESGEVCVGDLGEAIGSEQTNLSHQLRELRACGLVTSRQDGKRVYYRIAHATLVELLALTERLAEHAACTDPVECEQAGCC